MKIGWKWKKGIKRKEEINMEHAPPRRMMCFTTD